MLIRTRLIVTLLLSISTASIASNDITIKGTLIKQLPTTPSTHPITKSTVPPPTTVGLMQLELSNHAWDTLKKRTQTIKHPHAYSKAPTERFGSTGKQLGMNGVPVFTQGPYGTCATFAVTAALNAVSNQKDNISQLCHLQLGNYLEKFGYNPSGWDGSITSLVLSQLDAFGIIDKETERTVGCGGLHAYPHTGEIPDTEITLPDYHALSHPLSEEGIFSSTLIDWHRAFQDKMNLETKLNLVKQAINAGDRLTFGVILFRLHEGTVGAIGHYKTPNDTWLLTDAVIDDILEHSDNHGGHALVITGFNDYATVTDDTGRTHRGLLTLRNSWGEHAGDGGDFYMSYDYFKLLTTELVRIRALEEVDT